MEKILIQDVINALGENVLSYDSSVPLQKTIDSVCTDTRKLNEGCLFIGLKGDNYNGNDYLETAIENGAMVTIGNGESNAKIPNIVVLDTKKALLDVAKLYRTHFDIPIIAVTGSAGKTTTKEYINTVLSAKFNTLKTEGNLNNEVGVSHTLFGLDSSHQAAVIEMGMNHSGEISRLSGTTIPSVAVVTNIGTAHIEFLKTRENILRAKLEIYDGLKDDGVLILNYDDKYLKTAPNYINANILWYSLEDNTADVYADNIESKGFTTTFTINYKENSYPCSINGAGSHSVSNALAAFLSGVTVGVLPEVAANALANYKGLKGRQYVIHLSGVTLIDDTYNANPEAMQVALNLLGSAEGERKIAVLGEMRELGTLSKKFHTDVGMYCARANIDLLLCYGDNGIFYSEGATLEGMHRDGIKIFSDKKQLTKWLCQNYREGDTILFKGSRGAKMDDVLQSLLEKLM